jgi:hypothetical protein
MENQDNDDYYIPKYSVLYKTISPIQNWFPSDTLVNIFPKNDLITIIKYWEEKDDTFNRVRAAKRPNYALNPISEITCLFKDELVPTKKYGHPQVTIPRKLKEKLDLNYWDNDIDQFKVLRHLVVWRYLNDYALIPDKLQISHCDHDPMILNLVAESRDLNESRKYCHKYKWYMETDSSNTILCPHRSYHPCS